MRYTYFGVLAVVGTFWAVGRIDALEALLASVFYICGIELVQSSRARKARIRSNQRTSTANQWRREMTGIVDESRRRERSSPSPRKNPEPSRRRGLSDYGEQNLRGYESPYSMVIDPPSTVHEASERLFTGGASGGAGGGASWEPSPAAESTGSCSSEASSASSGGDCSSPAPSSD
jgi:hypothetical protein